MASGARRRRPGLVPAVEYGIMLPMTAAPAPHFEPHNRVAGKFRLGKRLATGGMGEVWVARNDSTGAEVALKMLRRGNRDHEHELRIEERFRHEAMLSAMLSHRSIVKVFDLILCKRISSAKGRDPPVKASRSSARS
jgi:serine/threonine protein kinase